MGSLEARREQTLQRLGTAYSTGAINTTTLERRIDETMRAGSRKALDVPTWDIGKPLEGLTLLAGRARNRVDALLWETTPPAITREIDLVELATQTRSGSWLIGRSTRCAIVVEHVSVSRVHAQLSLRDGGWYLRDLGSRNGTWNGRLRVRATRLDDHLPLRLGSVELRWLGA